jgi:predicted RNA-binding protein YlqC (UPF0109 family)
MSDYVEGDINTIEGGVDDDHDHDASDTSASMPEEVLTYLARQLSSDPDAVSIEADERGGKVSLKLHVGPDDMGRVIGRRGRTAQAIRTLVAAAGARSGKGTHVDIVDD